MRSAICRESISVYPSLMQLLGVEADAEREIVADLPPDRGDDLGGEAHPVPRGAPVPVGARVRSDRNDGERVGVGHVKLDAVEPGAARAPGGGRVEPWMARISSGPRSATFCRQPERAILRKWMICGMTFGGAGVVDRLSKILEAGEVAVVSDSEERPRLRLVDRHRSSTISPGSPLAKRT